MIKTEKVIQITVPTPYPVGDVHLYLLKGDTLSLIDAGVNTLEAWTIVKGKLKEDGYSPDDIEQLILTHHHPDHTGLIEKSSKATHVLGHKRVQPWIMRDQAFFQYYLQYFEQLYKEFAIPQHFLRYLSTVKDTMKYGGNGQITHFLQDGDELPGHPEWRVMETPGHARSHLSFYNTRDHSFFAGDLILAHISPNPLLEPPDEDEVLRPKPLVDQRESLRSLLQYPIDQVYPGHGTLFSGIGELVQTRLKKQEQRAERVFQFMKEKPITVFEACQKLFPTKYETQLGLTISETVGQLDYLESVGKVKIEKVDGQTIYYPLI